MSRLKIVYILSLVILGVLVVFTVFQPMAVGGKYSTVGRAHLLQGEDQCIIEFHIFNHEGRDQNYTITAVVDGEQYNESVLIRDGRIFTYIHHIYPDRVTEGHVSFAICKEGEETPFKQVTYCICSD